MPEIRITANPMMLEPYSLVSSNIWGPLPCTQCPVQVATATLRMEMMDSAWKAVQREEPCLSQGSSIQVTHWECKALLLSPVRVAELSW